MWIWIAHFLGLDNGSGPWYLFWSGFGSDFGEITVVGAIVAIFRHKNCIIKGCWRLGHPDPEHGHPVCRVHQDKV